MCRIFLLSTLLLTACSQTHADYTFTIHPSLPPYQFRMKWNSDDLQTISVYRDRSLVQTIKVPETNLAADTPKTRRDFFTTADFNFDGYQDLKLLSSWGAFSTTELYDIWLFDPSSGTFVAHPEFGKITAPEPDPSTKHVVSYACGRAICDERFFQEYDYQGQQLTLLQEERQEREDLPSQNLVRTVTRRDGGTMKEVCKVLLKPDGTYTLLTGSLQDCHTSWPSTDDPWSSHSSSSENQPTQASWQTFVKPSPDVLKKELTPLQYQVTQEEGTEQPFQNAYWDNHEDGIYVDIVSGEPLFSSLDKYDSHTGWPSFTKPLAPENIMEKKDTLLGYERVEVRSKHADSHLGHVFDDGPPPRNLRYCMNSAAMRFIPKEDLVKDGYGEFVTLFEKQ